MSLKERIRTVYGSAVTNELVEIIIDPTSTEKGNADDKIKDFGFLKATGAITNANYNNKRKSNQLYSLTID